VLPESEAKTVVAWSTAEINNESHHQESDNGDNFHTGKDEFGLAINRDGENVETDNENDDD
jgi:hypothetical protein